MVVYREPLTDEELNSQVVIVDDSVALQTDIRAKNGGLPILHASISAKWTMRSDRAQNSRTEALNLIRNRKGHLPHIVVVTGEPLPSRLASLALGTGDIDCMYHFALYELVKAVKDTGAEDSIEMLNALIEGKRTEGHQRFTVGLIRISKKHSGQGEILVLLFCPKLIIHVSIP